MYYGLSSGTFYEATFDGTTLGAPTAVDPYNDPFWSNVSTGSGQTYRGVISPYYGELPSVTGAFYNGGHMYYTLNGQPKLYWLDFNPESGIVGSVEFSSSGADMSKVAGMFLSGSTLYWASKADGALHSVPFSSSTVSTTGDSIVSSPSTDGNDWRSRNLLAYGSPTFPNQLPTASATGGCSSQNCSFDGTNSSDPDGSIASYAWNFGDGTTGSGATPTHHYNQAGTYTVSLVVTDNRGGQSTPSTTTVTAVQNATPLTFVGQASGNTRGTSASLTAPAGISAGDTAAAVRHRCPTWSRRASLSGLIGWTQIAPAGIRADDHDRLPAHRCGWRFGHEGDRDGQRLHGHRSCRWSITRACR